MVMVVAGAWLLGAVLAAFAAGEFGRSRFWWFLLAVLLSPLLAAFCLFVVGPRRSGPPRALIVGDGEFRFPVVGESHYQLEIERIAGGRDEDGARDVRAEAFLVPEPANPYDPNAVAVRIENRTVGYLSRDTALLFNKALANGGFADATCRAVINGGWDRGPDDQGSFGVRLDAALPFTLRAMSADDT